MTADLEIYMNGLNAAGQYLRSVHHYHGLPEDIFGLCYKKA